MVCNVLHVTHMVIWSWTRTCSLGPQESLVVGGMHPSSSAFPASGDGAQGGTKEVFAVLPDTMSCRIF